MGVAAVRAGRGRPGPEQQLVGDDDAVAVVDGLPGDVHDVTAARCLRMLAHQAIIALKPSEWCGMVNTPFAADGRVGSTVDLRDPDFVDLDGSAGTPVEADGDAGPADP
ncbi:hypothetical protein GCM10010532_049720 [Dactylosporangium siamense]|uniref:Uncharacterized protein n=1 Tax=Dactylosporangium siamense TaxID=685454 RepID=A0A919PIX9_9ACTN|nr:hypothetical protein Dsi01nite_036870 [Dactylosporangium siamense]